MFSLDFLSQFLLILCRKTITTNFLELELGFLRRSLNLLPLSLLQVLVEFSIFRLPRVVCYVFFGTMIIVNSTVQLLEYRALSSLLGSYANALCVEYSG